MGQPTIRDVARLAGVSHMTVSRVINSETAVRPQTRQLVQQANTTLNFSPNLVARALSRAEPGKIALVHRFPGPGYLGDFLANLLDQTTRAHASLVVRKVTSSAEDEQAVAQLVEDGVRAAILAPPLADDDRLVALLTAAGVAIVAVGSTRTAARLSSVGIDERAAAGAMTGHLLAIGHRRIGFVTGHPSHASTAERLAGYRAAMAAAGLAPDPALIAEGRFDYRSGLDAADALLALPVPPTAIFASNDEMAAAAVAVAHRRGIDVPADLSVVGFDDSTLATTIWPALTTVRQPVAEVTRLAVKLVLRERRAPRGEDAGEQRIVLDHLLVRRESDAPPRQESAPIWPAKSMNSCVPRCPARSRCPSSR